MDKMAKFQSKNTILTKKLNNVIYELMVKTNADMVYVDEETTLTEKLSDITDLFLTEASDIDSLRKEYNNIVAGADESFNTFKEVWDYVNINGNPKSELIKLIESKQSSEEGKGLSTHDLTDILYEKLINDYTREELDEKFEVFIDANHKLQAMIEEDYKKLTEKINVTDKAVAANASDIQDIKKEIVDINNKPNIYMSESESDTKIQSVPDFTCWYLIVAKDA